MSADGPERSPSDMTLASSAATSAATASIETSSPWGSSMAAKRSKEWLSEEEEKAPAETSAVVGKWSKEWLSEEEEKKAPTASWGARLSSEQLDSQFDDLFLCLPAQAKPLYVGTSDFATLSSFQAGMLPKLPCRESPASGDAHLERPESVGSTLDAKDADLRRRGSGHSATQSRVGSKVAAARRKLEELTAAVASTTGSAMVDISSESRGPEAFPKHIRMCMASAEQQ